MTDFVEMKDLTAWNGRTRVFHEFSLSLGIGRNTAILGPNGAGKSTLLKLLTHEIYPEFRQPAAIRLFGRERWNIWKLRDRLGIVSHDLQTGFPRHATGRDVVMSAFHSSLGVWPHQTFTEEERARAHDILADLGVASLADRRFGRMSTGEQRRVLLARALVHDPEVLVLDEPTGGLDPGACFQYLDLIRGLMQGGRTVVLVTHHIHEIPPEVERAVLLRNGQVIEDGPTAEVLTDDTLTRAFGFPIQVVRANGFFQVLPGTRVAGES
jgi:iron complex transport system ATP-binding protein